MWELHDLTNYLNELSATGVYIFLGFSAIMENIFPPYPGDTVTVFCGFLAAHKVITLPWAFVSVLAGNMIGAWVMYYAGEKFLMIARKFHSHINRPKFIKNTLAGLVSDEAMQKTNKWFQKSGVWVVLISRFSAGIRFFVSIVAGISKMNLVLFSFVFAIGVFIWNSILLIGGYALGDNWELILVALKVYNQVIISIIVLAFVLYIIYRIRKKKTKPTQDGTDR